MEDSKQDRLRRRAKEAAANYELLLTEARKGGEPALQAAIMELGSDEVRWTLFGRVMQDLRAEPADRPQSRDW